ncbi:MAG: hypothetical protein OEU51_09230 [Gammaproteobacteria bacterium]|nr:hypothetical protein [Gammaproteobacteria bacterium]
MKFLPALSAVAALVAALPVSGIVLDCEINIDGTYTCIEIGETSVSPEVRARAQENYRAYIEEAQTQCEYNEPRRRTGGRASSSAQRLEDLKRARREYDKCVATKAEALRQADQNTD